MDGKQPLDLITVPNTSNQLVEPVRTKLGPSHFKRTVSHFFSNVSYAKRKFDAEQEEDANREKNHKSSCDVCHRGKLERKTER